MLKYLTKQPKFRESNASNNIGEASTTEVANDVQPLNKSFKNGVYLESDPDLRTPILDYHPNKQDEVRRAYLVKGPTRPNLKKYPKHLIGGVSRGFPKKWYDDFDWLEVFCLPCYLFYNGTSNAAFVIDGYRGWNIKQNMNDHVGTIPNSHHKKCVNQCEDLMNRNQGIDSSFKKYSAKAEADYLVRLKASLEAVKYLVRGGMAFRGHNEGEISLYKGPFLELVEVFGRISETISEAMKSGGDNCKMTSPSVQKELTNACAVETVKKIVEEIGDDVFCILVDESGDCSHKEQMAVVVRFVDNRGFVVERFIGIVHVEDTSAIALKRALESLLSGFGLCILNIRGQGYDGASNMRGQFGGLKTLIHNENPQAY